MDTMEHKFTTYVRTKLVFKHRFKDQDDYDTVKIHVYELKKLGCNSGPLLHTLRSRGEIWYDGDGNFKPTRPGPVNPELLNITKKKQRSQAPLSKIHEYMRDQLMLAEVGGAEESSVYFKTFMEQRGDKLNDFFTVDDFSGRVHTPIVNLKHDLRGNLKLGGEECTSLDVKQMQPTILAKELKKNVGENPFSKAVDEGKDVYVMLQEEARLETRDEAKKLLFRLIFGRPKDDIKKMFSGDTKWVDWINEYKSKKEERNSHGSNFHTNLAWLLQHEEVRIMSQIWKELMELKIPFLTIHDDVLVRSRDKEVTKKIMDRVLSSEFDSYTIKIT